MRRFEPAVEHERRTVTVVDVVGADADRVIEIGQVISHHRWVGRSVDTATRHLDTVLPAMRKPWPHSSLNVTSSCAGSAAPATMCWPRSTAWTRPRCGGRCCPRVLHHLVETATHAGHLDVVRELLDGKQYLVL